MPDAPTFDTTTGEQCRCQNLSKTGWGVQSLLFLGGLSILCGMGYLLTQLMPLQPSALPPTAPVARTSFASPLPTETPSPSPTVNPLIPPTYAIVVPVTFTPVPTATMTSFQAQSTAITMTQVAGKLPKSCPETTPIPGAENICYWPVNTPTPIPTPTYKPCGTPLPGAFCKKES